MMLRAGGSSGAEVDVGHDGLQFLSDSGATRRVLQQVPISIFEKSIFDFSVRLWDHPFRLA